MKDNPLKDDLDHVFTHTQGLWDELRGNRLFITGGTGFFGCWLLESLAYANDKLGLNAEAVILTRNPGKFAKKVPHLAGHRAIRCHVGDVRDFEFPAGTFSHVIHAAAEADSAVNRAAPLKTMDVIVTGTRRVMEFADRAKTKKLLLVSSGAVYGSQPGEMLRIVEDYEGSPNPLDPDSAYGEGKRIAELLAVVSSRQYGWEVKIARGFAFLGPYLPLNGSFAAGNFVRDAVCGGSVVVMGDGTARRSYLYGADLAIWLWTILIRGSSGRAYNVGSEHEISMADLATLVSREKGNGSFVKIMRVPDLGAPIMRYVPDTQRARGELGLSQYITLDEGIRKMLRYYANHK